MSLASKLVAASPLDLGAKDCLARAMVGLGEIDLAAGKHRDAIRHFREVVEVAEVIVAAEPNRTGASRPVRVLPPPRPRLRLRRRVPRADEWLAKARDMASLWVDDRPEDPEPRALLSWSERKLADIRKLSGAPDDAIHHYLRAIASGEESVARHPDHAEGKRHLAIALHDLAGVLVSTGQRDDAERRLHSAESLLADLVAADPEIVDLRLRLVHAQYDLGRLLRRQGRFPEAEASFNRGLSHLLTLESTGRLNDRSPHNFQRIDVLRREAAACRESRR